MKQVLVIILIALSSITSKAQDMNTVNTKVTQLFVATDQRNWEKVEKIFAKKVLLDYSSMNGKTAMELTPKQITSGWKGILPGFESTHHQLGNFIVKMNEDTAQVFCYGTATHYLPDEKGNVWTVVGSYNFDLKKLDNKWRISSMKFNFKYQEGNTSLPEKAIKNTKK